MTLTYIFHSGFVLETEQSILVFDYWLDPSGVIGGVLKKDKPLYVFSSHFHEDHFSRAIFGGNGSLISHTYSARIFSDIDGPTRKKPMRG